MQLWKLSSWFSITIKKRITNLFPFGILITTFLVVNQNAVFRPQLWSDDFMIVRDAHSRINLTWTQCIADLRPIFAIFLKYAFGFIGKESDVWILHAFASVGIILLTLSIYQFLRKRKHTQGFALTLSASLICLPTFQEYVYFATASVFAWICWLSLVSYNFLSSVKRLRPTAGVTILIFCFLCYPPAAFFGLALLSVDVLQKGLKTNRFSVVNSLKDYRIILIGYAVAAILSYICAITIKVVLEVPLALRTQMVSNPRDVFSKVKWVLTRLAATEFRPFAVSTSSMILLLFSVSIGLGFYFFALLKLRKQKFSGWLAFLITLPLIPIMSAAANMIPRENQFEFRTLPGLAFGGIYLIFYSLSQLSLWRVGSNLKRKKYSQIFIALILLVPVGCNAIAQSSELWFNPSSVRDSVISHFDPQVDENVCIVLPKSLNVPLKRLGMWSQRTDLVSQWTTDSILYFVGRRHGRTYKVTEVVDTSSQCLPNHSILDFSQLMVVGHQRFIY